MKKQFHLTQEGVDELRAEMEALIAERAPIAERIKTAREFGDLSENAEYSSARQEQERCESRISEIDHILKNLTIITSPKKTDAVQLGSTVELKSEDGKTKKFTVVGTVEADPLNGKISDESPIGMALMGKKISQDVEIKTPAETITYKVIAIS
jgi:transcription elongation factor GreA